MEPAPLLFIGASAAACPKWRSQEQENAKDGKGIIDRRACGVAPQLWGFVFGFSFGCGFGLVLALVLVLVLKRFWPVHYNVVAFIVGPAGDDKSHVHCSAPPCLPDRADRALSCSQHVPLASFTRCFLSSQPHRIVVNMHCENI